MATLPDPYWTDGHRTLYCARWEDVLPALDQRFDLVFTSPPYNLSEGGRDAGHSGMWAESRRQGIHRMQAADGYTDHDDAMPHDDYVTWQRSAIQAMWDHLTDTGAIFYNHKPLLARTETDHGPALRLPLELIPPELPLRQIITWNRMFGANNQRTRFTPSYEWLLLIPRQEFRTVTRSMLDVWNIPPDTASEHPAPFPIGLPAKAIAACAPTSILDPFSGSGTTLRAAADAGIDAVGIEPSEMYCEMTVQRLAQLSLFGRD